MAEYPTYNPSAGLEMQVRHAMTPYFRGRDTDENKEVRDFFKALMPYMNGQARAATPTDLPPIPNLIVDMVQVFMGNIGRIYSLVTQRQVRGSGRIYIMGDTIQPTWDEFCAAAPEVDPNMKYHEFDGFQLASYVQTCPQWYEDSYVDLAAYYVSMLTKGNLLAFDQAIIGGLGKANKQPTGIVTALQSDLSANYNVPCDGTLQGFFPAFGQLSDDFNNFTCIMTRQTYYKWIAPKMLTIPNNRALQITTNMVPPNMLPDGTPVIFCSPSVLPHDQALIFDFSQYMWLVRAGMTMSQFPYRIPAQDTYVIRVLGRYDGLPLRPDAGVHIAFAEPEPEPDPGTGV